MFAARPLQCAAFDTLRPHQEVWLANLLVQDDRKIMWIAGEKVGLGKTEFGKYLIMKHDAFWTDGGKYADIACAYESQPITIFDFKRSVDETCWPYKCIERMRDGMLCSGKYESQMKLGNKVTVVVMSNTYPDIDQFSVDRWDIWHYDKDHVLHRGDITLDPLHVHAVRESTSASRASGGFSSNAYNPTLAQIPALGSR